MAVGLAVRTSYSADDPGALVVSGVLDSLSAGILIYTGLVEVRGRPEFECGLITVAARARDPI
jgi:zinc transporter 1/2/3